MRNPFTKLFGPSRVDGKMWEVAVRLQEREHPTTLCVTRHGDFRSGYFALRTVGASAMLTPTDILGRSLDGLPDLPVEDVPDEVWASVWRALLP
jgi:hypothetical protein